MMLEDTPNCDYTIHWVEWDSYRVSFRVLSPLEVAIGRPMEVMSWESDEANGSQDPFMAFPVLTGSLKYDSTMDVEFPYGMHFGSPWMDVDRLRDLLAHIYTRGHRLMGRQPHLEFHPSHRWYT